MESQRVTPEGDATAVAVHTPEALPDLRRDPAALLQSIQVYAEARAQLLEWIRTKLTPGVDYLVIHKKRRDGKFWNDCPRKEERALRDGCPECGAKPTLAKPGAEKISGALRVKPVYVKDAETWEMFGALAGMLCLKALLVREDDPSQVVSEGRGARLLSADGGDPNKCVKMVEKSAHIDAVLRYGGLSELFTQDLEDLPPVRDDASGPSVPPPPRRKGDAPPPREPGADDLEVDQGELSLKLKASLAAAIAGANGGKAGPDCFKVCTPEQRNKLFAVMRERVRARVKNPKQHEAGFEKLNQKLHDHLGKEWGLQSLKELPQGLFEAACQWVQVQ